MWVNLFEMFFSWYIKLMFVGKVKMYKYYINFYKIGLEMWIKLEELIFFYDKVKSWLKC